MNILAIETSCDETAASVVSSHDRVLSNVVVSQMDIHAAFGGVVPEVASRHHVVSIQQVIQTALDDAKLTARDIDVVAVTKGPGLIGALLVGINAAKAFSYVHNIPLLGVDHLKGHIHAISLSHTMSYPLVTLLISGGHTELIYMPTDGVYELLGATKDDAVGEAYDKVARTLGLGYPGGPLIDQLATKGVASYHLPTPMKADEGFDFSFSGLKSAVINLIHNETQRGELIRVEDLCASFQKTVIDTLVQKTIQAARKYQVKQVAVVGGVSANVGLRNAIEAYQGEFQVVVPKFEYCTDNAAMIGAAAFAMIRNHEPFDTIELDGNAHSGIFDQGDLV
jgi:N6-L-threonylcarbamoyladenine synthase